MSFDDVVRRLLVARPRVAEELHRPHSEESLLAEIVNDVLALDAASALTAALGLRGRPERLVLWGADALTGVDDIRVAAALHRVAPSAGRAALLELEPDLVVVTDREVAAVDATVGRPGHLAARARRGEPVPQERLDELVTVLRDHGLSVDAEDVQRDVMAACLAAVATCLGDVLSREPHGIALGAPSVDLLHPDRDDLAAWAAAAVDLVSGTREPVRLDLRVVTWLDLARRLEPSPGAEVAVRRIRMHPVLAATRARLG